MPGMENSTAYLDALRNPLLPREAREGVGYLSASCSLQRNKWRRHEDDGNDGSDDGDFAGNTCGFVVVVVPRPAMEYC